MTSWGETQAERDRPLGCDAVLPDADLVLHRAVDVAAPAGHLFRWLCQLRVAPYSYDLIDNRGRRSPRELTPGLDRLELGQPACRVFTVVHFTAGQQLTIRITDPRARRLLGDTAMTYAAVPAGPGASRLLARVRMRGLDPVRRRALAYGDLVMMRKQLRTFATLAERTRP